MAGMRRGANFSSADVPANIDREPLTFLSEDGAVSRGLLYRPAGARPNVGVHIMHPRTDQTHNYSILPLVKAGYAVLGRTSRWVNNDIATIHEHLLLDVAEGVKLLRKRGCERVVLLGNSGGGSLAACYQAQARKAPPHRLAKTAAGDPFDLNKYDLPPADGIVLIGAHMGEGFCLMKWLDPSLADDTDPLSLDPELDMYGFANGFKIPPASSSFSKPFLTKFRAAQKLRAERMDAIAQSRVAQRREAVARAKGGQGEASDRQWLDRGAQISRYMEIFRTMADPAFVDPSIDPDDRDICAFNNDPRPDLLNYRHFMSPFLTPEAYLSTWSGLSSHAYVPASLAEVPDPLLHVHYAGDSICRIEEARMMFAASIAADKEYIQLAKIDHYGFRITGPHERGERDMSGTEAVVSWMRKRFPLGH